MPIPLALGAAAPAAGFFGKLALGAKLKGALAALKGGLGMGGTKQLALNLGGNTVKQGGLQGVKRFAGNALRDYMGPGGITPTNLAVNFGFDAGFGVLQGINTPGDLGDKIIAGTTAGVGGALGGIGAVGMLGKHKNNTALRMLGEFGGGYAGDMAGQVVGDTMLRAKGGGTTPWEKVQQSADQEYRQQLEQQILAQYGIGGYNVPDMFMTGNGLG